MDLLASDVDRYMAHVIDLQIPTFSLDMTPESTSTIKPYHIKKQERDINIKSTRPD